MNYKSTAVVSLSVVNLCIALSLLMLILTAANASFDALSLYPEKIHHGQYWRLLTANFVHFGWAHTLMNVAALLLCAYAFFNEVRPSQFLGLLLVTALAVGAGIYVFNPEYQPYAGLSGVIHGLIVAGLIRNRRYPLWIRIGGLLLVAAKLVQENSAGYEATDLQALIPAAVAVEAHVYGAIAGALFATGIWLISKIHRK
jgi:rhomboid family GlyGly-CTERM serine protease